MKKNYLFLLLIFVSTIAFSQKLLKPQVDKLSGDTTWNTSNEAVYAKAGGLGQANNIVQIQCSKIDKSYAIFVTITSPGKQLFYTSDDSKIYFKLSDKTIITLPGLKGAQADFTGTSTGSLGLGTMNKGIKFLGCYMCTKDDLNKLKSNTLEFLRLDSSIGNLDYDISPKLADKVQKEAELIAAK